MLKLTPFEKQISPEQWESEAKFVEHVLKTVPPSSPAKAVMLQEAVRFAKKAAKVARRRAATKAHEASVGRDVQNLLNTLDHNLTPLAAGLIRPALERFYRDELQAADGSRRAAYVGHFGAFFGRPEIFERSK
jgi:hypothetical protein